MCWARQLSIWLASNEAPIAISICGPKSNRLRAGERSILLPGRIALLDYNTGWPRIAEAASFVRGVPPGSIRLGVVYYYLIEWIW